MPRTFTSADLTTLTTGEYAALSATDRAAFDRLWWAAVSEPPVLLSQYLAGDYDRVGSNRRFELGE